VRAERRLDQELVHRIDLAALFCRHVESLPSETTNARLLRAFA
jgi:hypothetical protein